MFIGTVQLYKLMNLTVMETNLIEKIHFFYNHSGNGDMENRSDEDIGFFFEIFVLPSEKEEK